uniref:Rap-GAP domain-containing protein n=1 Tax=Globodera pallida TaxID=36090 RepID=A0A183CJF3_GLOPA
VAHVDIDSVGRQCAAVTNRGNLFLWDVSHTGMMQPNGPPFYLQQPHQQQQFVDQQRQGDKENGGEQLTEEQSVLLPPLAPPPTADLNLFQFPTNQQQQHHHRDGAENRQPPRHVHQQSMHLPPPQLPHVMHHRQLHAATQQPIPQHHPLQPVVVPQQPSAAVAATVPPPLVQVQPIRPSPPPPLSLINSANKYTKVRAHQTFALKCRFRPDGLAVATTSADQSAKLWSCNTHKLLNSYSVPGNKWVWDCAFTNDSKFMVTASSDGMLRMGNVTDTFLNKMLRKKPYQDLQNSLNRFTDLGRDPVSRAKHFRSAYESLNVQERRQLFEGFSFEIFHLIDALFLAHYDSAVVDPQTIADVESALWILEQALCSAPELVGKGWQKNGIEFVLKMALHPDNVLAVRKLAIRLFLIWYQELASFGQTTRCLDTVFKCCLPHFPLRSRAQSEQILMSYCEGASISVDDVSAPSAGTANANNSSKNGLRHQSAASSSGAVDVRPARALPIVQPEYVESVGGSAVNSQQLLQPQQQQQQHSSASSSSSSPTNSSNKLSFRERAQSLQIYLDKFLEYTTRETIKIDWADPSRRMECANFMLDRVIVSYIYEVFPDAEANGVDVFGGWEGTLAGEEEEDGSEQDGIVPPMLDTVDPIIIARYWLIRWIINIASESKFNANANGRAAPPPGLALFKQALFSSQRATNVLLTLMREAFRLPLACCIVIQKVLDLLRHWLLQREFPPFVESGLLVPYYCSANTELIFHVSTLLNGDNTQRLKHLGNDEVHVVWSENNSKPYRRDLIATRFCDVLIVLYLASPVLLRVHIEVQDPRLQFGPLFDGACIHVLQAASLVRETVLNASRAYRNLRVECDRPNKHREKVFREKKQMLTHHPLASALVRLLLHPKMSSSNGSTRRRGGGQEGRRGIIDENQGIA